MSAARNETRAKNRRKRARRLLLERLELRSLLAADMFPIAGDFNHDGIDTAGIYDRSAGTFHLRNENSTGFAQTAFAFGPAGGNLLPVAGDWNNDGYDTVGLFDPATAQFYLAVTSAAGTAYQSTQWTGVPAGGIPLVGNFAGDGADELAIYDPASRQVYLKQTLENGPADEVFSFWPADYDTSSIADIDTPSAWQPLAGDFATQPGDEIALYQRATGELFVLIRGTTATVSHQPVFQGGENGLPIAGDWDADGDSALGFLNPQTVTFAVRNNLAPGVADSSFYVAPVLNTQPLPGPARIIVAPPPVVVATPKPAISPSAIQPGPATEHHNSESPADVDADGQIAPLDALLVINVLNDGEQTQQANSGGGEGESSGFPHFTDVNNDAFTSPIDALLIINALNDAARADSPPEGEPAPPPPNPADLSNTQITEGEVKQLLARGAAASSSQDAIIAIVDRAGNILGVRMEAGVLAAIPNELTRIFAIDGAVAKARTAAFFASNAAPLTSRTIRNLSQSTITEREVESNPTVPNPAVNNPFNDADATATTFGPGFVAPIGVGGHFPPGVANTPPVDLFGIEHQSRDGIRHPGADGIKGNGDDITLASRFNVNPAFVPAGTALSPPESYGVQSVRVPWAQSRGIATLPGGIPLFKTAFVGGQAVTSLVGGIGVFFPGSDGYATHEQGFVPGIGQTEAQRNNASRVLEAEWIAFAAAGGSKGGNAAVGDLAGIPAVPGYDLPFGRIDLVGITLEVYGPNPTQQNPRSGIATLLAKGSEVGQGWPLSGDNQPVTAGPDGNPATMGDNKFALEGKPVAEGWLVMPHASPGAAGTLSAADVTQLVTQAVAQASITRAAIRLPLGTRTSMVISVADTDGNVLGIFRMPDATIFSIDVSVAKARNTAYYADPAAIVADDLVNDDLLVSRGALTYAQLGSQRIVTSAAQGNAALPDLYTSTSSSTLFTPLTGVALSNRTFRFLAEPRYPAGVDGTVPPIFSSLNDHNLAQTSGVNPRTAENLGAPVPASKYQSVLGFDAFHLGRNFRDGSNIGNQNGVVFFPGSTPLYESSVLVGGFGVSGDGVDQDDVVTFAGQQGFAPAAALKADQVFYRGVRLPFQKFNRNPEA